MRQVKEEWKQIGEDVSRTVQDAIMSGDYRNLSSQISEITNRVFDNVGRTINASGVVNSAGAGNIPGYHNSVTGARDYRATRTYQTIRNINENRRNNLNAGRLPAGSYPVQEFDPIYRKPTATKVLSILGIVFGFSIFSSLGLVGLFGLIISIVDGIASDIVIAIVVNIIALSGAAGGGISIAKLVSASRFDKYVRIIGGRMYVSLDELAVALDMRKDKLIKDLRKMIAKGWFRQGHLDEEETTLILSNEVYQQYLNTKQANREMQQQREEEQLRQNEEYAQFTPAQREIIQQGEQFVEEIRRCNDLIPGKVISEKIARLENSISMIMARAKEEPSLTGELRRLMNYYLPTTVKLLHAYADLDKHGKSSENIEQSKKEIEDTIDTMNVAFDKLFDSMFETTSLDISTDASVMKTLLEQEGLTGHSFGTNTTMPLN